MLIEKRSNETEDGVVNIETELWIPLKLPSLGIETKR